MMRRLVRGAIRNARVTRGEGVTLRIDPILLRAADILPLEDVEVVVHATGERIVTFAEPGEEASGELAIGRVRAGDAISILCWGLMHDGQTLAHRAKIVTVDEQNRLVAVAEA